MYSQVPPKDCKTDPEERVDLDVNIDNVTSVSVDEKKPKHVPSRLWEKFKALEKRTDEETKRSTEKRMKHLRKNIAETVAREITREEDKDILRSHDVKFGPPVNETSSQNKAEKSLEGEKESSRSEEWSDVKKYLDSNKNLEAGVSKPRTKLDQKIDQALARGDYSSAETLSDRLANRDFGKKIAHAFDARDFVKRKKEEETEKSSKKKKKLNWGFEHKQRWEMKSNM